MRTCDYKTERERTREMDRGEKRGRRESFQLNDKNLEEEARDRVDKRGQEIKEGREKLEMRQERRS